MALHPPRRHLTSVRTASAPKTLQALAPSERQHHLPHLHLIPIFKQLVASNTLAVHIDAIRTIFIVQHIAALVVAKDHQVQAGYRQIVQKDVAVATAPDRRSVFA